AQYIGIAQEMNLPATAFLYEEHGRYKLRWFTPTNEIGLCGHATLATGKILFEKLSINKEALVFDTKGGQLTVKRKGSQIEMDFPMGSTRPEPNNDMLLESFLGEKPIAIYSDADLYLVEVESSNTVKNLEPNFALLQEHPKKRF